MNAWGWLLAYVLGFGLLQLLLYRYFRGDEPSVEAAPNPVDSGTSGRPVDEPRADPEEGVVRCGDCGARNDADGGYTYCRECASALR